MINEILEGLTNSLKKIGEKEEEEEEGEEALDLAAPSPDSLPSPGEGESDDSSLPSPEDLTQLLGGGTEELEGKVKELEDRTNKIDSTLQETLTIAKQNNERLEKMESNMRKFLSLYELVTNQVNPFIESPTPQRKMMLIGGDEEEEEEKKIEMPRAHELEAEEQLIKPPTTIIGGQMGQREVNLGEQPMMPAEEEPEEEPEETLEEETIPEQEPQEEEEPTPETPEEIQPEPQPAIQPQTQPQPAPAGQVSPPEEQIVFLQSVKDGSASFALEWITGLLQDKDNIEKNTQILKYLLDLGWITPKAYNSLQDHLAGIIDSGKPMATEKTTPKMQERPQAVQIPINGMMPTSQQGQTPDKPRFPGQQKTPTSQLTSFDSMMNIVNWIQDLVNMAGPEQANNTLEYLKEMGWLTPDAYQAMQKYIEKSTPQTMPTPQTSGASPPQQHGMPSPQAALHQMMQHRQQAETRKNQQQPGQPQQQAQPQQPGQQNLQLPQIQKPQQPQQPQPQPEPQKTAPQGDPNDLVPLTEIGSDLESLAIVLEWIRYFVDTAGMAGTEKLFRYYQDIGWITEDVHEKLLRYKEGIKAPENEPKDYQPSVEDHATTLFFISKLKKMELSKEDIEEILGG